MTPRMRLSHTRIMTQTKIERKYFRLRVNEKLQNKASLNSKKLALAESQELTTTNITGGAV